MNRPYVVKIAVIFLYLCLLFFFAEGVLSVLHSQNYRAVSSLSMGNGVYLTFNLVIIAALWVVFSLISLGWGSMRYVVLVFYAFDLINWIVKFYGKSNVYLMVAFPISLIELTLGIAALILLFLPSSHRWFLTTKKRKKSKTAED